MGPGPGKLSLCVIYTQLIISNKICLLQIVLQYAGQHDGESVH